MRKGAAWEFQIELWNREYRLASQARVVKCHPGAKITERGMVYESAGPPDFMGALNGGRLVVFDAKEVQGMRMPLKNLKPHQANDLEDFYRLGAYAFILVQWMHGDKVTSRTLHRWENFGSMYRAWQSGGDGPASLTPFDGELLLEGWLPLLLSRPR